MNTHLHITSWVLALILLIVVIVLHKQGKEKGAKITHMILRLDYLLILYSGGALLANYLKFASGAQLGEVVVKTIAGILLIAVMEMIGVKMAKQKPLNRLWIYFTILFILTLALGFGRLPYGILP